MRGLVHYDPYAPCTDLHGGEVDRGVDAVGYQAHDPDGDDQPEIVPDELVQGVEATGGIGVVGVCLPEDPGAANESADEGTLAFAYDTFFFEGQSMGTGQCDTQNSNAQFRDPITTGRADSGFLVSHELPLELAAHGYDQFDERGEGWTQVVLHPGQAA